MYLDQNHWSHVGLALSGDSKKVSEPVAEAAHWLAARADSGEILMPLSKQVELFVETRRPLWRRPATQCGGYPGGGSPECGSASSSKQLDWLEHSAPGSAGARVRFMADTFASATKGSKRRISWALAVYEAMLDLEPVEDPGDAGKGQGLLGPEVRVGIAEALRRDRVDRETVAQVARLNLLLDADDDISAVGLQLGMPADAVMEALSQPGTLEGQRMLALMLQVLTGRLHNAGQQPEPGDLFDFVYLPCAAAYAVFVGERRMIGFLRGARRPSAKAALAVDLPAAVQQIQAALASAQAR